MATAWLTTLPDPSLPIIESWEMPVIKTDTDMGYERVRARYTSKKKKFQITYPAVDSDDIDDIEEYFDDIGWNAGDVAWTHPRTAETIVVRLDGGINVLALGGNLYRVVIRFAEVPLEISK